MSVALLLGNHKQAAMKELAPLGLAGKVVGGGRIETDPKKKTVLVFGYSKTFGRAAGCNQLSSELVQADPVYRRYKVTWNDDGY